MGLFRKTDDEIIELVGCKFNLRTLAQPNCALGYPNLSPIQVNAEFHIVKDIILKQQKEIDELKNSISQQKIATDELRARLKILTDCFMVNGTVIENEQKLIKEYLQVEKVTEQERTYLRKKAGKK